MADDDKKLEGQEGNEGGGAGSGEPEDKKTGEEGAAGGEPGADDGIKDKHGQPGINREKYQRDIKERDDKIAELEARIAEASETKEGREKLEADLKALREEMADKDVTHALEMLGCKSVKAAKALLADYDNDPAKVKEAAPYLFGEDEEPKKKGTTGKKPAGPPDSAEERTRKAREAAGLKPKE